MQQPLGPLAGHPHLLPNGYNEFVPKELGGFNDDAFEHLPEAGAM